MPLNRGCKYGFFFGRGGFVIFSGLAVSFTISGCVTEANVGEYRYPATNVESPSGAEETDISTGGSGVTEPSETIGDAGGGDKNDSPPVVEAKDAESNGRDRCIAKDHFNDFEVKPCDTVSSKGRIELIEEQAWVPDSVDKYGWGTPLVANLTDDDGDGDVDLCDNPDIVIVAGGEFLCFPIWDCGYLYLPFLRVIDGKRGELHDSVWFTEPVYPGTTPAIGDIDRDGSPDVIAASRTTLTSAGSVPLIIAFEKNGAIKWKAIASESISAKVETLAISLADLDNDGFVEVIVGVEIFDGKTGKLIVSGDRVEEEFNFFLQGVRIAPIAADLDGDQDLEVIVGPIALHHDGSVYYDDISGCGFDLYFVPVIVGMVSGSEIPSYNIYPIVAELDDDLRPEVVFTAGAKVYILEHNGYPKRNLDLAPYGVKELGPPTVHDMNGDGKPEIAFDSSIGLIVTDRALMPIYVANSPSVGSPGCVTTFDFQGDGVAEIIYSDGAYLRVFDLINQRDLANWKRESSRDCPVVADVDNDGSSEIVTVNQQTPAGNVPTLQILSDSENRWVPTRRIWNQQSYHVTNIKEDSTVPQFEIPNWLRLNTYRANVQVESDTFCLPIVE
ncbi:MAG: VCBS repeat-containing protein [Deltaproteobacteria bacterium]|nr:VCBS repeat-containing protein [Deltaproteobacteria bacterium]